LSDLLGTINPIKLVRKPSNNYVIAGLGFSWDVCVFYKNVRRGLKIIDGLLR